MTEEEKREHLLKILDSTINQVEEFEAETLKIVLFAVKGAVSRGSLPDLALLMGMFARSEVHDMMLELGINPYKLLNDIHNDLGEED